MTQSFKPFLFILFISTVLVAGISLYSYSQSKVILKERMTLSTQQTVMQTVDELNLMLRTYEDLTYNVITDAGILSSLQIYGDMQGDPLDRFNAANQIKSILSVRFFSKADIKDVHFFPIDSLVKEISTVGPSEPRLAYVNSDWYKQAIAGNGRNVWLETRRTGFLESGQPSFAISRILTLPTGMKYILFVEISTQDVNSALAEATLGKTGEMVLLNDGNRLLSQSRQSVIGDKYRIPLLAPDKANRDESKYLMRNAVARIDGKQQLVVTGKLASTGWTIEAVVPVNELIQDTAKLRNTMLICIVFIGIATFLVNYLYQRRRSSAAIRYMAYHDHLTDLANRKLFNELLDREVNVSKQQGLRFAVLFIDLDRLKLINDTFGHGAGDKLLVDIATKLKRQLPKEYTAARFGGDEFLILMPNVRDGVEVELLIHELAALIQQPIYYQDKELYCSASIGVSMYPQDGDDGPSLIKNADMAMYSVKESGRSSHRFYDIAMDKKSYGKFELERDLRKALEREQLLLVYQPQVHLESGTIVGVEALVRWKHHEQGMISPANFIPIAEETRLIIPIGEWILYTACRQNKSWQEDGLPPVHVSVNLSIHQFQSPGIVDNVARILRETGLAPQWLELEITESIAMHDVEQVIRTLQGLSDLGVKISIDDFGTGYSSLSYLKNFPIERLKVDKSFLDNMIESPKERAIVGSIIVMSHSLGLKVTAEGVEKVEQVQLLRELSCDDAQGYYYSRPLLPDDCAKRLAENATFAVRG
ncbi:EAL domain-containing protein [Paenibacillus sp. OV219]|uniref:bifunctional diguanylate cyclase/phosphodiesterase n=1 Tax=Paenibacillus sp. OV219 TaxID=1884377 RepID=UPI0008AD3603|nr:EAL domain-containing protein [Paenibacillus sp. OV219]SEO34341.1 diguanylate cyclase (GGDEF) domain-containing protein [Paenibacillus sp. OV219]